ncbi:hypothetical protein [Chromohalobacter canadensis]|uniref:Uncharacterized protein n=1 Tax=Chromohalobacter canadensis TaxID=141389 RepID=A0ABZ0YA14_9GAMM|nr:hypothetical protein [Chromohalobacter canadensis]MCK0768103.1 hypothetical protein [Chromohalobacter canadensis]WQH08910.1 hypothetical protein SR908_15790 [Chromohalobacter canadensis]
MQSVTAGTVPEGTNINAKANQLILVNLSSMGGEDWLEAMRDAGQPWHEELIDDLSQVKALLQSQPRFHALICYDSSERQIANCLGKGRAPSQALANWTNQTDALLELYREHYQRITLVTQEDFEAEPKALCEQLSTRSGIALGRVDPAKPANTAETDPVHQSQRAMYLLLARQALEHPPAKRLLQELEASSLPLDNSTDLLEWLDGTYDLLKQSSGSSTEYEELKNKLEDVQQENDLVIEQLHKTQEELEQYLLGNKNGGQKVEKLERNIQQKNEKLHSFSQKNKWLRGQLETKKKELNSLRSSKSWALTAPLRKVMHIFNGKKNKGAA